LKEDYKAKRIENRLKNMFFQSNVEFFSEKNPEKDVFLNFSGKNNNINEYIEKIGFSQ